MFAVGACSSGGDDDGLTAERDDALTALAAAKTAAAAAAIAAEEAQAAALAAAALAAEAAQMTALAEAATAAAAAQEAALAAAATAAEVAKMEALVEAATAAEAAKVMALAAAATAAEAAKVMALAEAATAAAEAHAAALAEAATAAAEAHAAALAEAATAAAEAHAAALTTALAEAATMAAADQAEALRIAAEAADAAQAMALAEAATAADAAQAMALAEAATAADAAQAMALAEAATAADAAQAMALAEAATAADAAQAMALAEAATAADAAQAMALAEAATAADAAQAMALAEAATAADAKLMAANDGLVAALQDLDLEPASDTMSVEDQIAANTATLKEALALFEEELAEAIRVKADKMAIDMAKAVHKAIGANTAAVLANNNPPAAAVKLEASSDSVVTARQDGYTMSETYPDEITGWRGVTLEKDGDTTVIYSNIEDAESKEIGNIYGAASGPGEPEHFDVRDATAVIADSDTEHDIPWSVVKRSDSTTTVLDTEDGTLTSFAGTVSGLAGVFSCTDAGCEVPTIADDATVLANAEGEWTFVPNDPNGTIDVADLAYVSFGWWLDAIGDSDEYEFDAFASATGMGEARSVVGDTVEGGATYKGGAAGKYAILSTTDDSATGGHFTATATLTANFDANTDDSDVVANANELGVSIGGSITDFMTGDVNQPSWKVTLTGPVTPETTIPVGGATGATSWDTGGAVKGAGAWNAIFYGGEAASQPAAVIGEFNAAIGGGAIAHISGAFGATKQ